MVGLALDIPATVPRPFIVLCDGAGLSSCGWACSSLFGGAVSLPLGGAIFLPFGSAVSSPHSGVVLTLSVGVPFMLAGWLDIPFLWTPYSLSPPYVPLLHSMLTSAYLVLCLVAVLESHSSLHTFHCHPLA